MLIRLDILLSFIIKNLKITCYVVLFKIYIDLIYKKNNLINFIANLKILMYVNDNSLYLHKLPLYYKQKYDYAYFFQIYLF